MVSYRQINDLKKKQSCMLNIQTNGKGKNAAAKSGLNPGHSQYYRNALLMSYPVTYQTWYATY